MISKYNGDLSPETKAFIKAREEQQKIVDRFYEQQRQRQSQIEEERTLARLENELMKKLDKTLDELFK